MKILLVEDDPDIADFIKEGFKSEGFAADIAADGKQGSYMARLNPYDVIVLDYSLPGKNGIEVCQEIRSSGSSVPIIFLSVIDDTQKKIEALGKGADDYITKPFSFEELMARVKALLRRPNKIKESIIKIGDLSIDINKKVIFKEDTPINLTRKEYNLLEYLMRNQGMVVSRSMILEHVWNAEVDPFSNTVEAHILNLRKKIGNEGKKDLIKNIPGRGYLISE
jgi:DNA-binding response OmpR family regulator